MSNSLPIDELYQAMLGRLPDPDARRNCIVFLKNGGTLEALPMKSSSPTNIANGGPSQRRLRLTGRR